MPKDYRVKTADLTRSCSKDPFDFATTADLEPLDSVIGQRRGVEAIDFGLNMKDPGYHIFITGEEGTGKSTIIKEILAAHAKDRDTPGDLCLVNNFDDEYCPMPMEMPTGSAVFFSRRMAQFIETLKVKLPQVFDDKVFQEKQDKIKQEAAQNNQDFLSPVEEAAAKLGIGIVKTEQGVQAVPLKDGRPMSQEEFQEVEPDRKKILEQGLVRVGRQVNETLKKIQSRAQEMQEQLEDLAAAMAGDLFSEEMDLTFVDFKNWPQVRDFLGKVKKDMEENITLLLHAALPRKKKDPRAAAGAKFLETRYQVNVLVDRRGEKGAPIVFESNPGFQNLFGKIEKLPARGGEVTDFSMVQAGSILQADKGYLVLEIEPLLRNPMVWETLKNTLQNRRLCIQDPPDQAGFYMASLKPGPIPLQVKVILLGGYNTFHALQGADPKFNKIFKVRADFDHEVELSRETLKEYARFIARVCKKEKMLPFSPGGVGGVVEQGARMTEDKNKLSLRFGRVLDLLKEADYWARREQAGQVDEKHVARAVNEYRFRHNLYEEKVQERYDDQSILLDVTGEVVGQVNALAVYQIGEIAFGRPTRITAESYMGKPGIVNVEHEAELSGQTHDKGVMIIAGYLGRVFAQNHPLSVSLSITFEQSYSGIDGDSASSTELYAVLSSLSGYPIRQSVAVTGSVNQKGEIQAIGGVNEKIEGFFDVCLKKGLSGDQGVMIPLSNVKNLLLRKEVVKAVESGMFHIYRVSTIEQGIEVLTGIPAGKADKNFNFPEKSLFGAVQAKLKKFHDRSVCCTG
ncbi:Lon protease family protein [Desulfospira joergensenii]|uniref:Lon protease family protein n=1 Tax=Desulfospira joergensenii TaxID=53329 RepID=UPI0003B468E0|nr:ATP-binding protein [Desulfospira joergensenii]